MSSLPSIQVHEIGFHLMPMRTRFPFRYGIAAMTHLTHLFLRVEVSVAGKRTIGYASEGLPPKWFTKHPETTYEEDDLPNMLCVISHAAETAMALGEHPSLFRWWRQLYDAQSAWAKSANLAPLLAHLGTSLLERAVIDAFSRSMGKPFGDLARANAMGMVLHEIHPILEGMEPGDLLPSKLPPHAWAPRVPERIWARHTIGLGDPLTAKEAEDRPDDPLPYTLEECIAAYGLRYFKIKISGNLEADRERLRIIFRILQAHAPGFKFTLDGNEQFKTFQAWAEAWRQFRADPELAPHLALPYYEIAPKDMEEGKNYPPLDPPMLFAEQPIHRDYALNEPIPQGDGLPYVIIDESDAELDSARRALELNYSGTSHKNCKGVMKGIANACLMRMTAVHRILSGEDLGNVGPVALLQDLAVMQTLGIEHVERNGHHYFKGLSMYPEAVQRQAVERHPGLYRWQEAGFATLDVRDGKLDLSSVSTAPFGVNVDLDWLSFTDISELLAPA